MIAIKPAIRYPIATAVLLSSSMLVSCVNGPVTAQPPNTQPGRDPAELIINTPPADPEATLSTRALYQYIIALSRGDLPGVVSGQNCYHGDQISAEHQIDGYRRMVEALHAQSGKWVGMIGLDYGHDQIFSADQLSKANQYLVDYWKQGGWITINWAPLNPWISKDRGKPLPLAQWNGPGSTRDLSKVDLYELTNPHSAVYANWRTYLDRIASALEELQDAGVVVLWRPLQEMNGSWFW